MLPQSSFFNIPNLPVLVPSMQQLFEKSDPAVFLNLYHDNFLNSYFHLSPTTLTPPEEKSN